MTVAVVAIDERANGAEEVRVAVSAAAGGVLAAKDIVEIPLQVAQYD